MENEASFAILNALFDSRDEIYLLLQNQQVVFFNETLKQHFNTPFQKKTRLKELLPTLTGEQLAIFNEKLNPNKHTDEKSYFSVQLQNRKNENRWFYCSVEKLTIKQATFQVLIMRDETELKLAEEAIETNLNFLNSLLETIPNPLFYKNSKGIFIGCNTAFAKLLGREKNDIIGFSNKDFLGNTVAEALDNQNNNLLKNTTTLSFELVLPGEEQKFLIVHKKAFQHSSENTQGILGVITDITDQKSTEKQLYESKTKFQFLLNEAPFGILQTTLSGDILYTNKHALTITQAEFEHEILSLNLLKSPFFTKTGIRAAYSKSLETKTKQEIELHTLSPWNAEIHALFTINPIIEAHNVKSFLVIIQDISAKQRAIEILRASDQRFKALAENSLDAVWLIGFDKKLKYANSIITELTGFEPHELIQKKPQEIFTPESCQKLDELIQRFQQKITLPSFNWLERIKADLICYHKTKGQVWIETNFSYYKDKSGEITGLQAVSRDVSQRMELIENLKLAKEKAEQTDKIKTAFVANVSHEIRTPLNSILGFTDFLSDKSLPEHERNEYVKYIKNNGFLLLHLVNEIIDTSKIEAGKIQIELSECNINELLNEIYETFSLTKSKNQVNLVLDLPQNNQQLVIKSDKYRLRQTLTNLINNALKFTDSGTVKFGYRPKNTMLEFFVSDTGIGIPKNKYDIIFKRFGKVEENYTRNSGGTGLGLSLAKSFIELLDGKIWFESEIGKGTTFFFTLPLKKIDVSSKPLDTKQNDTMEYNWTGKKLLIAEDADMNFILLDRLLRKTQIEVTRAENGQIAIDKFKENSYDIILMDMQMPEIDGFEATRTIKQLNPEIPIIAQTAFAMDGEEDKVIQAGCDDYVSKPINKNQLFGKINKYLGFDD